jgi:23S rRNA (uracil1939-C5)-methyltransferase
MVNLVCHLYRQTLGKKVLDLYCGTGNFTLPLALAGANITGVEQNPESICWAGMNAEKYNLTSIRFIVTDAGKYLQTFSGQPAPYDTVVLDPPRQGLGRHTETLAALRPKKIIYVSCNPVTLARDTAILIKRGYNLFSLTPVDMFPQTNHIETVSLLEKN